MQNSYLILDEYVSINLRLADLIRQQLSVGKNVHATIPKGNIGYDKCTVPDTEAVEPTFVASL